MKLSIWSLLGVSLAVAALSLVVSYQTGTTDRVIPGKIVSLEVASTIRGAACSYIEGLESIDCEPSNTVEPVCPCVEGQHRWECQASQDEGHGPCADPSIYHAVCKKTPTLATKVTANCNNAQYAHTQCAAEGTVCQDDQGNPVFSMCIVTGMMKDCNFKKFSDYDLGC